MEKVWANDHRKRMLMTELPHKLSGRSWNRPHEPLIKTGAVWNKFDLTIGNVNEDMQGWWKWMLGFVQFLMIILITLMISNLLFPNFWILSIPVLSKYTLNWFYFYAPRKKFGGAYSRRLVCPSVCPSVRAYRWALVGYQNT